MRKSFALGIIREHNSLNGLRFVMVEFVLVAAAAIWICTGEAMQHRALPAIAAAGIAINGIAVVVVAARQLRSGDENIGILRARLPAFRSRIAREHPDLGAHTVLVVVFVLVPFLLLALLLKVNGGIDSLKG